MDDHYNTLGVAENASEDDIKKAFRKLAMQHHPDKNPGNREAEERFKKINDAYGILGDRNKRAEYDQIRKHGGSRQQWDQHGFHFNAGGFTNIDDMIRQFFNQNGFDQDPFGFNNPRRNRDLQMSIEMSLEDAFTGKDVPVRFNNNGHDVNVVVKIPRGVENGIRMRFQGYGDKSVQGIPPGDLYITVIIQPHPTFHRDGPHLHTEIKVDAFEAMLGINREITCIDGGTISLNIPAGTQVGSVLRVKGRGMPLRQNQAQRGDLMATIGIVIPANLSDAHRAEVLRILGERKAQ